MRVKSSCGPVNHCDLILGSAQALNTRPGDAAHVRFRVNVPWKNGVAVMISNSAFACEPFVLQAAALVLRRVHRAGRTWPPRAGDVRTAIAQPAEPPSSTCNTFAYGLPSRSS